MEEEREKSLSSTSPMELDKVKFFCCHGGKILPRHSDGTLKYVGGETRVIGVPRSITFSGLMQKIKSIFYGEYVLKYQIALEDLDSLVSVKSDEDIRHMLDEYDRIDREGNSKLRTFLFPMKQTIVESQNPFSVLGPHALDQRFIDAINGIVRSDPKRIKSFSPSPTEGSPPQSSPPRHNIFMHQESSLVNNLHNRLARMHKVQSSPSLCSLGSPQNPSTLSTKPCFCYNLPSQHHHYHHAHRYPSCHHEDQIHNHQNYHSPTEQQDNYNHNHLGYRTPANPFENHMHPSPQPLVVKGEYVNDPFTQRIISLNNKSYYHPFLRNYPGSGGHNKWGHLNQYASSSYRSN